MSLTEELVTWLPANVSALSSVPCYRQHAPQGTTGSHVVVSRDDEDPNNSLDGAGGTKSAEITIECKAGNPNAAETLANVIIADLEPYSGAMGDVTCKAVILQNTGDSAEASRSGKDIDRYVTTIDLTIHYE